ncbi:MAG: hypothetical protein COV99_08190 [Bacteroidetes bacterium CG12_big_fil_rev_8_21_14_0_65_60_17]|nr:MAG: hypothetical protein COV99_08190 [Bacteroidetes bacterium CG12_big_fil_rev_8_21_14_0_65_60_17]
MTRLLLLLLLCAATAGLSSAQSNGDYRTGQSGWWSSSTTWETYSNGSWSAARRPPRNQNAGAITVRTDHFVIADQPGRYDQIHIEPGSLLYNITDLTVNDGTGVDLFSEGLLWNYGTIRTRNAALLQLDGGSTFFNNVGDRVELDRSATMSITSGALVLNSGTLSMDNDARVSVLDGGLIQNSGAIELAKNALVQVTGGRLANAGSVDLTGSSSLVMETGGVFEHAQNGGALPEPARTTWNPGSVLEITGVIQSLPVNMAHDVQTFIWNNTGQTANLAIGAVPSSISEDFIVRSTGSAAMAWDLFGAPLDVGRDLVVESGVFVYQVVGSGRLSARGNVTVATDATLDLAWSTGAPELRVSGNLTVDGLVRTGSRERVSMILEGPATHILGMSGTWRDPFDVFVIDTGSLLQATDLSVSGSFIERAGGVDMASHALEIYGDLELSQSPATAGPVLFTGDMASTMASSGGALTFASIIIDRPGGSVSLQTAVTARDHVTVRNGTLTTTQSNLLTLPHGATLMNAGTVNGPVQMQRSFTLAQDGWRMLATPVSGTTYSSLNEPFLTQGRAWADVSGGASNVKTFQFASQDWANAPDADEGLAPGSALILYAFSRDALGKSILPATWTVTGNVPAVSPQTLSFDPSLDKSYNYTANPGTANIDWDATVSSSSGVASSYATWDPQLTDGGGTTGYRYYDAKTGLGLAGRYIAPFTGIMTEAVVSGATLAWTTTEAAAAVSAEHFGKGSAESLPPHVRLAVEGEGLADNETYVIMSGDGQVPRLSPLSRDWTTLWTRSSGDNLAFDARLPEDEHILFDLHHAATKSGVYTLSWPDVRHIPDGWTVQLIDLDTGEKRNLLADSLYRFTVRAADVVDPGSILPERGHARFRIIMASPDWAGLDAAQTAASLPEASVILVQNYPNPFMESTTIRFATHESGHVELAVYDMLGRRVALLQDTRLDAGWHDVMWRPQGVTSGLYAYRLRVGGLSVTKTLSFLKR